MCNILLCIPPTILRVRCLNPFSFGFLIQHTGFPPLESYLGWRNTNYLCLFYGEKDTLSPSLGTTKPLSFGILEDQACLLTYSTVSPEVHLCLNPGRFFLDIRLVWFHFETFFFKLAHRFHFVLPFFWLITFQLLRTWLRPKIQTVLGRQPSLGLHWCSLWLQV